MTTTHPESPTVPRVRVKFESGTKGPFDYEEALEKVAAHLCDLADEGDDTDEEVSTEFEFQPVGMPDSGTKKVSFEIPSASKTSILKKLKTAFSGFLHTPRCWKVTATYEP